MKKLIICALFFTLLGCAYRPQRVGERKETREYIILKIIGTKHVFINLQDARTGKKYYHVYVAKYCMACERYTSGQRVKLTRVYWTEEGKDISEFTNICTQLENQ